MSLRRSREPFRVSEQPCEAGGLRTNIPFSRLPPNGVCGCVLSKQKCDFAATLSLLVNPSEGSFLFYQISIFLYDLVALFNSL